MKKNLYLLSSLILFAIFVVFTVIVKTVDVQYVNEGNYYLGLHSLNFSFGNMAVQFNRAESMKKISDVLLYLSFAYVAALAVVGVVQLIKYKSLAKVDKHLFVLLGAYVVCVIIYFAFEVMKVNYSPDVTEGIKASYPSSHVFIGCTFYLVNSYAALKMLKSDKKWAEILIYASTSLICFMIVVTRSLALKHWISDIIASLLLVGAVYLLFVHVSKKLDKEEEITE